MARRSEAKMTTEALARVDGWVGTEANGSRVWIEGCNSSLTAGMLAKQNGWESCRPYQLTKQGYLIQA